MELRTERVVLETSRQRIVGDLSLPSEGYRSRLSDYLNRGDVAFVPLTDASITSFDTGATETIGFVAVARDQIQTARPADD